MNASDLLHKARVLLTIAMTACVFSMAPSPTLAAEKSDSAATQPAPMQAWVIDARDFKADERLSAVCLQGLANREKGQIYLDYGGKSLKWTKFLFDVPELSHLFDAASTRDLAGKYGSTCDVWVDELSRRGFYRFEKAAPSQMLKMLKDRIKGVILFGKVDDDLAVAATMAGLRDAVPMTDAVYQRWVRDAGLDMPVIFDVRSLHASYPKGTNKRLAAHRWAIDHLLSECDKHGAVARDRTYNLDEHDTLADVDLAVQNRWITYNLSSQSNETKNSNDTPLPGGGFDPPDKELVVDLLSKLEPFSPVYGWGSPDENTFVRRLSIHSLVAVCGGVGNGSFYKRLPMISRPELRSAQAFQQSVPHLEPDQVKLDKSKIYIAFMVNEGDTLKTMSHFQQGGFWLQKARGTLPINWGVDAVLCQEFPGLSSYYYATATPNDYFFMAPSGWGYTHPTFLPKDNLLPYAEIIKRSGELTDTRYIDVWWISALRERKQYFPMLQKMGVRGMTQWSTHEQVEFAPDGTPIIHSRYYYTLLGMKDPEKFSAQLRRETEGVAAPWFIVVYGGSPDQFAATANRLPQDRFKIVKLDEFFEAARIARPLVEGRKVKPAPSTRPTEAAPGAGEAQVK